MRHVNVAKSGTDVTTLDEQSRCSSSGKMNVSIDGTAANLFLDISRKKGKKKKKRNKGREGWWRKEDIKNNLFFLAS